MDEQADCIYMDQGAVYYKIYHTMAVKSIIDGQKSVIIKILGSHPWPVYPPVRYRADRHGRAPNASGFCAAE